jgi:hypothetical protein
MLDAWADFYLLIGSAAAALIGLLFVVTTLTAGRERSQIERGTRLYTSPIVFHLSLILLLSGAAMAPGIGGRMFGLLCDLAAAAGAAAGVLISIGIHRGAPDPDAGGWFDIFWYGALPAFLYLLLFGAGIALAAGCPWGAAGAAALLMALLLAAIHNAWDLVTWLAPKADAAGDGDA